PSPLPAYKLPGSSSGLGSGRSKRKSSIPCKSVAASSSSALEEGESVLDEMDCSVLKSVARPDTYQPDLGHIGFLQSGSPQEVHDVISQESNFQDKNFYPYSTLGRPLAPEVQLSREKVKHFSDNPNNFNFLDQNFQYRKDIKKHVLIRAGIKPYQCDFCGEKFNRSDYLREHTLLHTGEKPYKCDLCGAKFIRSSHLKRHKLIHTGEKPHICGLCDARFNQESSLKRHILIHTGEKPYKCDVCEARFNQASSLKQHTLLHTGEKPYKCDVCDERFKSRRNLKQHLKITHIDPLEFQKRKSLQL
ncbi:zinc finger and SCAN domain-containing protein 22, partial [Aplysia californica]|uniref:Zinc finger and SCAN domain-containing protein 22 n=1 Tax=Aplysia californica TaxID=6500 RepID=A0ABM0K3A0_APLCA